MSTEKTQQALEKAQERVKQLKAKIAKTEQRERAKLKADERAKDTRRKILLGAYFLDVIEKHGHLQNDLANLEYRGVRFANWLTKDEDKSLFGIQPQNHSEYHSEY